MANPPVSRASLLAGLRTGGVRASSGPVPHTAAPGASFNISRIPFQQNQQPVFPEEDDQVLEIPQNINSFANDHHGGNRTLPMTAAVDGLNNRFSQQQRTVNPANPSFVPGFNPNLNPIQAQAFQLQMMQLELMKIQAQNYQAEVLAQAQRQTQQPAQNQFVNGRQTYNPPATAGPMSNGFDLRSATLSAQMRRANADQLRSSSGDNDQVPMTAALGGKFGSRSVSANGYPSRFTDSGEGTSIPNTPNTTTTVISGGIALGSPAANNTQFNTMAAPSKSDAVSSWRRPSTGNSALGRSFASPSVKVTPPPPEQHTDSPLPSAALSTPSTATPGTAKFKPQPLRFSMAVSQPLTAVVAVDSSDPTEIDDSSSSTSNSTSEPNSSPDTPRSSSSHELPLSPREEASRKLYEGLGIGRPVSSNANKPTVIVSETGAAPAISVSAPFSFSFSAAPRVVSQPLRQPRGPPSGMEDLAPQNFATRIKNQAINSLGMLRSEIVEAY